MKRASRIALMALVVIMLSSSAYGIGFIIPQPIPDIPRQSPLTVKSVFVTVEIEEQVAKTTIKQVFYNPHNRRLEGTYYFPLPRGAAVDEFVMWIAGERVKGELMEVEKARKIYEDIVRSMRDPALLEYIGSGIFRARVFPIEPNSDKQIEISYTQALQLDGDFINYTFPMKIQNLLQQPISQFSMDIRLDSSIPLKTIYSPSHQVDVNRKSDKSARIGLEAKDFRADKHFQLLYSLSAKDMGLSLLTYNPKDEDGFFLCTITPQYELKEGEIQPKDIIFVLDISGSMRGEKIEQAKNALKFGVQGLSKDDTFNIIAFSNDVRLFKPEMAKADAENISKGVEFIESLDAGGGTNINGALLEALKILPDNQRTHQVIFLTDGEATVGETNTANITKNVAQTNDPGKNQARFFIFGVGYDVNTNLLDSLAVENKGISTYVEPNEDIEVKVSAFYTKVSKPVLTDLKLDFGKIDAYDIYPSRLPDLFKGSQLIITGRYKGSGATAVKLTGKVAGKSKSFTFEGKFPKLQERHDFIANLWANRKVGFLLEQIKLHGETKELKDEVVYLGKRYGIMTPYTAYLVTEKDQPQRMDVAHHAYSVNGFGAPGPLKAQAPAMGESKGKAAVQMSKQLDRMKRANIAEEAMAPDARAAGGKIFYAKDNFLVDSSCPDDLSSQKTLEIKFLSDAYMELMKLRPDLKDQLALAANIKICLDDLVLIISEDKGLETLSDKDRESLTQRR